MSDINVLYADMPTAIRSYVVSNTDMTYTVVLNSRLSHEQNLISYTHELKHINDGDYDKKCSVNMIEINAHRENIM